MSMYGEIGIRKRPLQRQRSKSLDDLKRAEQVMKDAELIRHEIRKTTEEKQILRSELDLRKIQFLDLYPKTKAQKARIDAAYQNQKGKLNDKIGFLESKHNALEKKLSNVETQLKTFKGATNQCILIPGNTNYHQNDSKENALKAIERTNVKNIINENDFKPASCVQANLPVARELTDISHEQLVEIVAELQSHREYVEEHLIQIIEEKQNISDDDLQNALDKTEINRTSVEQLIVRLEKVESYLRELTDNRCEELNRLKEEIDEHWTLVSYRWKETTNDILERFQQLEYHFSEIETLAKTNGQRFKEAMSNDTTETVIGVSTHLIGILLIIWDYLKNLPLFNIFIILMVPLGLAVSLQRMRDYFQFLISFLQNGQ